MSQLFALRLCLLAAALAGIATASSSASGQASSSTPLAPKPGQVVQGGRVVFRLAVSEDVIFNVVIYAGPSSMRVVPSGDPDERPVLSGGVRACEATFGDDRVAVCVYDASPPLAPGANVWYAVVQHEVWDPVRRVHSYPYRVEGPYSFTVAAVPPICRLKRQPGRLVVRPRIARVGDTVTVTGSGFVPGYTVAAWPAPGAGSGSQPRPNDFNVIPRSPVYLGGHAYAVKRRSVSAARSFRVTFRLPSTLVLAPSWPGEYWIFVAAQMGTECSRIPGYQTAGPLYTFGAVFLKNPAA